MKYQLIIFDMDGTLVQSEDCASQALIDVIPALLGSSSQEMTSRYRGMNLATILEDIETRIPGAVPESCIELYREREETLSRSMITPSIGVELMLELLSTPKCIASNAPVAKTRRSLDICNLSRFFESGIFSAYEVQAWKPDPKLFLSAAAMHGVSPASCLVVEDSSVGIEAANAAGMDSVFYDPHEITDPAEAPSRITALTDVLTLIR